MTKDPEQVPMERIPYGPGTGAHFTLLVFTKDTHQLVRKYGGDPVNPLYGPQARRLRLNSERPGSSPSSFVFGPTAGV